MNIISIAIFVAPLSLAIFASVILKKRSQLWLEVFAGIMFLTMMAYGVIFWFIVKDAWILKIIGAVSTVQFVGLLLYPIISETYYQQFLFKSLLFDGQSRLAPFAKNIRDSRWLSSLSVFLFFLLSFEVLFYSIRIMGIASQALWAVGFSAVIAVKAAINWKPNQV